MMAHLPLLPLLASPPRPTFMCVYLFMDEKKDRTKLEEPLLQCLQFFFPLKKKCIRWVAQERKAKRMAVESTSVDGVDENYIVLFLCVDLLFLIRERKLKLFFFNRRRGRWKLIAIWTSFMSRLKAINKSISKSLKGKVCYFFFFLIKAGGKSIKFMRKFFFSFSLLLTEKKKEFNALLISKGGGGEARGSKV